MTQNLREATSPLPLRGSQTAHTSSIKTPVVIASIKSACHTLSPLTGLVTQTPEPSELNMLYGATTYKEMVEFTLNYKSKLHSIYIPLKFHSQLKHPKTQQ